MVTRRKMWKPTLISVKTHMKLTVLFWYEEYILMDQNVKAKLKLTSRISWKKNKKKKPQHNQKSHLQTWNQVPVKVLKLMHSSTFLLSEI